MRDLATYLLHNGIEVVLDQWDVDLGEDLGAFMENAIRRTDRVIAICTDAYVRKSNNGVGGVGYEKRICTAEILSDHENRRKFILVVRDVIGNEKIPAFFGAALYLDLSEDKDCPETRNELVRAIYDVPPRKLAFGSSQFIPEQAPPKEKPKGLLRSPLLFGETLVEFSDRFSQAFPGLRGVQWFDDPD